MDDQGTTGAGGGIRFRKLRIAWSVGWGILCVLLLVLWMRSHSWLDVLATHSKHGVVSWRGALSIVWDGPPDTSGGLEWVAMRSDEPGWLRDSVQSRSASVIFTVRHLAAVFITMTVAAIAWAPSRFSLRALLIATTLVAVVLGLIVWAAK